MHVSVTITPGLSPLDRGSIEDAMLEALGDRAELLGGGTMLGEPSTSDFSLEVPANLGPPDAVADACRRVLEAVAFSVPMALTLSIDGAAFEIASRSDG